jgi:hypothetical protein
VGVTGLEFSVPPVVIGEDNSTTLPTTLPSGALRQLLSLILAWPTLSEPLRVAVMAIAACEQKPQPEEQHHE